MRKCELIEKTLEAVRNTHDRSMNLTDMTAALESLCDVAAAELLGGGSVSLPGLGKLKIKTCAARTGRNPRTGEQLEIPAGKKVCFMASKSLKDALK